MGNLTLEPDKKPINLSEQHIKHAYDQVVTLAARLSSFSTGRPTMSDGPINERQEMLALDGRPVALLCGGEIDDDEVYGISLRAYKLPIDILVGAI